MDYLTPSEIIDRLNDIITTMELKENDFYVALEVAYQLKDEITQALSEDLVIS